MKTSFKLITLFMTISLVLISCGAPGANPAAKIDYKETANKVRALSNDLSNDMTDVEARK